MKIVIDDKEYVLGDSFKTQCIETLYNMVKGLPIPELQEDIEKDPLVFIDTIVLHFVNKYHTLPMLQKTIIMAFVRGHLASMENTWGPHIRPDRGEDPVIHIADFFMSKLIDSFAVLREEVIPHGVITVSVSNGQFASFTLGKDPDQAGGTVALNGDIGIRQDDGRENDRQAALSSLSTNEALHIG